jgi:cytochrome c oxidase subunit 2
MWWWEVRYPEQGIVTANEIHVPAGQAVKLELTSVDVIHSFWAPSLHGKRDMIPGLTTTFWIQADQSGVYRGQCAEYCGLQHANMAFVVVALPPDEFAAWMSERSAAPARPAPAAPPSPADLPRGLAVFLRAGCAKCHSIRGTPAEGKLAPDLTHIGSRQTLAAGTVPNNRGNLAGWIANPQALKPGAKMPATYLPPEELFDLVSYLEGRQ